MVCRMGIPPATLASNIKSRLAASAKGKSSAPYFANTSLLAVTTLLPFLKAFAIKSLAGFSLPSNSTTMSISGSSKMSSALAV